MNSSRSISLATGVLFIMTFVFSIPALLFYSPVLNHPDYVLGAGADTRIAFGAFFEIILVIANIGTAIAIFPMLKRQSESVSLGYVASRVFESAIIGVGIVSLLAVVTLRQDLVGATGTDAAALVTAGRSLVAIHDATFLLGPAFCAGFGNGVLLGYLMFKSGLVPRQMAILGLVGGPLAIATATAVLFGLYEQTSAISFFFTIPEILWEGSFGIYLTVKGFKPAPLAASYDAQRAAMDAGLPSSPRAAAAQA